MESDETVSCALSKKQRVTGAIMGLAAGDRNGVQLKYWQVMVMSHCHHPYENTPLSTSYRNAGPMRMVIRLAESLIENQALNMNDVAKRYHAWFLGPPHDPETAFDTGPTWTRVFGGYKEGEDIKKLYVKASTVKSWGVNSAHREIPLACCGFLSIPQLIEATISEGSLTHADPVAIEASIAFVLICRSLIEGKDIKEAIENAKAHVKEFERMLVTTISEFKLHGSGKASETLHDSLFFVLNYKTFEEALLSSIDFAGANNYCPVLVGAMSGAMHGIERIPERLIYHSMVIGGDRASHGKLIPVKDRLVAISEGLSATWTA